MCEHHDSFLLGTRVRVMENDTYHPRYAPLLEVVHLVSRCVELEK